MWSLSRFLAATLQIYVGVFARTAYRSAIWPSETVNVILCLLILFAILRICGNFFIHPGSCFTKINWQALQKHCRSFTNTRSLPICAVILTQFLINVLRFWLKRISKLMYFATILNSVLLLSEQYNFLACVTRKMFIPYADRHTYRHNWQTDRWAWMYRLTEMHDTHFVIVCWTTIQFRQSSV